ncbi:MAG: hypothetical protein Kow00109_16930 [Acidobacteriota bacterium]
MDGKEGRSGKPADDGGTAFRLPGLAPDARAVISGGQTGVDRAALDAALKVRLPASGWCPRGRLSEEGPIPARYPLQETPSAEYGQRTAWNVQASDGTLLCCQGPPGGGTALTWELAIRSGKPLFIVDLDQAPPAASVWCWLQEMRIRVLNVAGPRESQRPGIYRAAFVYLCEVLEGWRNLPDQHIENAGC